MQKKHVVKSIVNHQHSSSISLKLSYFYGIHILFSIFHIQSKSLVNSEDGTLTYETTAGVFSGFDCLIWAVGRTPNSDMLDLEKVVSNY